jgi:hypothetical protein
MTDWRQRLSDAVDRMGRRTVAKDAGISLATLNHILRDETSKQTFETIVGVAKERRVDSRRGAISSHRGRASANALDHQLSGQALPAA